MTHLILNDTALLLKVHLQNVGIYRSCSQVQCTRGIAFLGVHLPLITMSCQSCLCSLYHLIFFFTLSLYHVKSPSFNLSRSEACELLTSMAITIWFNFPKILSGLAFSSILFLSIYIKFLIWISLPVLNIIIFTVGIYLSHYVFVTKNNL